MYIYVYVDIYFIYILYISINKMKKISKINKIKLDCIRYQKVADNSTNIELKYDTYATNSFYCNSNDCGYKKFKDIDRGQLNIKLLLKLNNRKPSNLFKKKRF